MKKYYEYRKVAPNLFWVSGRYVIQVGKNYIKRLDCKTDKQALKEAVPIIAQINVERISHMLSKYRLRQEKAFVDYEAGLKKRFNLV